MRPAIFISAKQFPHKLTLSNQDMTFSSLWGLARLLWHRHRRLLLALLLGFVGPWFIFVRVAREIWEDQGFPGDQLILQFLHAHGSSGQDALALWLARAGGPLWAPVVPALILLGLLLARQKRAAAFFGLAVIGSGLLNLFAKYLLARTRPTLWESIAPETSYSFPSGHAMAAAALAAAVAVLLWPSRGRWLAIGLGAAWALSMGWSRTYLGVHYPSDVLAGWLGSLGWVGGLHLLFAHSAQGFAQLWEEARRYRSPQSRR
jgi:membrane-associated phospholipid phosphatase